jgi:hypothetical protein
MTYKINIHIYKEFESYAGVNKTFNLHQINANTINPIIEKLMDEQRYNESLTPDESTPACDDEK